MKKSELLKLGKRAASLNYKAGEATREFEDALSSYLGLENIYEDIKNIGVFDLIIDIILQGNGEFSKENLNEIIETFQNSLNGEECIESVNL